MAASDPNAPMTPEEKASTLAKLREQVARVIELRDAHDDDEKPRAKREARDK